jgi:hypothetical protein
MLTGIHFLLTYKCTLECDHCFLYCGPKSTGTFTIAQVREILDEAERIGTVERIYFEGGEAFMYYPLMLEGIRLAREKGFEVGIVTNSYFALTEEDAELWLRPIADIGITQISISEDEYHFGEEEDTWAKNAMAAAKRIGIKEHVICIQRPKPVDESTMDKDGAVVGGGPIHRGRAVEKIAVDLPKSPFDRFTECDKEELRAPKRVHVDAYGHVHICQGIVMGNMWKVPLSKLVKEYDPEAHPIVGPLLEGGPVKMAEKYGLEHEEGYASACHFCYMLRLALIDRFPEYLAPRQVYGLEEKE